LIVRPGLTPSRAPFVFGALGLVVALAALFAFFVGTYVGQSIDEHAFDGAANWQGPLTTATGWMLDALPAIALGLGAVLVVVIVVIRRAWRQGLVAAAAALAALGSTQILKNLILVRPQTGVADGLSNSLPSGHTTAAAAAALAVFLVASARTRPVAVVLGSLFTVLVGVATLIHQWHRPSDVIAAMLVACFWGCAAGFVLVGIPTSHAAHPCRTRLSTLGVIAALLSAVAVIGLGVTAAGAAEGFTHLFVAYMGSVASIGAVGFGLAWLGNGMFAWLR
jgi:membrane-associated phospholipid phosphatase